MKFIKVFLAVAFFIFLENNLNAKAGNQEIIDDINDFLQTIYQGYYEVNDLIDLDKNLGDMRVYDIPTEDPYGTIEGCYFFVASPTEGPENLGNIVGIYKDGNVLWYSDEDEIGIEGWYNLYTTRDINNNGKVEILISEGYPGSQLWIYSWDGTTGERINDKEEGWNSVIQGPEGSFTLFDAEGDGILEIRSLAERDGSETWSWNGQLYGRWGNTPIMSDISWFPRDNITVNVGCDATKDDNVYAFKYSVYNDSESEQRVDYFTVACKTDSIVKTQPQGWDSRSHWVWNQEGWGTEVFNWNKPKEILPGRSLDSFKIVSPDLPVISLYVVRGENMLPLTTEYTSDEDSTDFVNNSVKGFTIGPSTLPNPFVPLNFLDTLINYTQRSLELDWITNQNIADKYDSLFSTAKTLLEGNHIPWVNSTLHTVLAEANEDSSGNITSEAYALLRYNTEYLIENLPDVIPPVLTTISPAVVLRYTSGGTPPTGLTVTATGNNFSDSSIVYFNGNVKTTTIISDTVLTFPISGSEMSTLGSYPIWISTYGVSSDTLTFKVVDNLITMLQFIPTLQCVQNNGDGSYTAYFGYVNDNGVSIYVPIGSKNKFVSIQIDKGQPKLFLPGTHTNVFSVNFNGRDLSWILDQTSVTANKKSTACP